MTSYQSSFHRTPSFPSMIVYTRFRLFPAARSVNVAAVPVDRRARAAAALWRVLCHKWFNTKTALNGDNRADDMTDKFCARSSCVVYMCCIRAKQFRSNQILMSRIALVVAGQPTRNPCTTDRAVTHAAVADASHHSLVSWIALGVVQLGLMRCGSFLSRFTGAHSRPCRRIRGYVPYKAYRIDRLRYHPIFTDFSLFSAISLIFEEKKRKAISLGWSDKESTAFFPIKDIA